MKINNQITITTSSELKNFYDVILHAVVEDGLKVHLLYVGHRCSTEPLFDKLIGNKMPSIRCIFISADMIEEFLVMNAVIQRPYRTTGLENFCPNCGAETVASYPSN